MKKIILFFTILIIISFNIYPVLSAKFNTPKDVIFLGQASWFDPWDVNLYASVIHSGQTNGILLSNSYTTFPNKPIFMYPLYTILGSMFNKANPFFLFHLSATLAGTIFAFCIFYFLKFFLKSFSEKIFALLAICLGGGFGFLAYPNLQSADLAMTSFTFLSAFQRGHEAIGLLAYIASLVIFFNLTKEQAFKKLKLLSAGISLLLISLIFYPYYFLSFVFICGIYLFIKNKGSLNIFSYAMMLPFLIPSAFLVLFLYVQISGNQTFAGVLSQNLPTPNLLAILLGYGLLFPLFIYRLFFVKKNQETVFLSVWIIVSILLAYLPLGFSRFYLRGLYFPLAVLSFIAIGNISKRIGINKILSILIFTLILLPSTFKITYSRITAQNENNPWYYLSQNEYSALEFLKNSKSRAGIISLYKFGNIIPAYANNTVYFGHLLQTPNANEKLNNLYAFYAYQMTTDQAKGFLKSANISYVLWGTDEKTVSGAYEKGLKLNDYYTFLKPVFENNAIIIFATM